MQRFLKWLGKRLFPAKPDPVERAIRPELQVVRPARQRPVVTAKTAPKPAPAVDEPELVDFETGVDGHIEDVGPGKNVLIRNKYLREDTGTHETLKILDDSIVDTGEEAGFDPYNTGQFDRSANWKRRNRK